jgi:hypothetical protein
VLQSIICGSILVLLLTSLVGVSIKRMCIDNAHYRTTRLAIEKTLDDTPPSIFNKTSLTCRFIILDDDKNNKYQVRFLNEKRDFKYEI